eukprot:CAMPEP_0180482278 /NCGR_PEP_ID=MMETSP1036_2-20121128/34811_1 /TAXON_ID=632150 /ORGANISM="Azadinium spinosum, Strain 3D9" /LENGTH=294 /DNA_ID=CAMNT_0022490023 /DNA_START=200 /DNA_END=1082 /DNA_ORIENTATION=-
MVVRSFDKLHFGKTRWPSLRVAQQCDGLQYWSQELEGAACSMNDTTSSTVQLKGSPRRMRDVASCFPGAEPFCDFWLVLSREPGLWPPVSTAATYSRTMNDILVMLRKLATRRSGRSRTVAHGPVGSVLVHGRWLWPTATLHTTILTFLCVGQSGPCGVRVGDLLILSATEIGVENATVLTGASAAAVAAATTAATTGVTAPAVAAVAVANSAAAAAAAAPVAAVGPLARALLWPKAPLRDTACAAFEPRAGLVLNLLPLQESVPDNATLRHAEGRPSRIPALRGASLGTTSVR